MSAEQAPQVPASFLALYATGPAGRLREGAAEVAARHELCEDLAQLLTEHARTILHELDITEELVLERIARGLLQPDSVVRRDEARWVVRRLAELLNWLPPPDRTMP